MQKSYDGLFKKWSLPLKIFYAKVFPLWQEIKLAI